MEKPTTSTKTGQDSLDPDLFPPQVTTLTGIQEEYYAYVRHTSSGINQGDIVISHEDDKPLFLDLHRMEYLDVPFNDEEKSRNKWVPPKSWGDRAAFDGENPKGKLLVKRIFIREKFPITAKVTKGMKYTDTPVKKVVDLAGQTLELVQRFDSSFLKRTPGKKVVRGGKQPVDQLDLEKATSEIQQCSLAMECGSSSTSSSSSKKSMYELLERLKKSHNNNSSNNRKKTGDKTSVVAMEERKKGEFEVNEDEEEDDDDDEDYADAEDLHSEPRSEDEHPDEEDEKFLNDEAISELSWHPSEEEEEESTPASTSDESDTEEAARVSTREFKVYEKGNSVVVSIGKSSIIIEPRQMYFVMRALLANMHRVSKVAFEKFRRERVESLAHFVEKLKGENESRQKLKALKKATGDAEKKLKMQSEIDASFIRSKALYDIIQNLKSNCPEEMPMEQFQIRTVKKRAKVSSEEGKGDRKKKKMKIK